MRYSNMQQPPPKPVTAKPGEDYLLIVRKCEMCQLPGMLSLRDGLDTYGIRCMNCEAFFHARCLDPRVDEQHLVPSLQTTGDPVVYVCDYCADLIEEEDEVECEDDAELLEIPPASPLFDSSDDYDSGTEDDAAEAALADAAEEVELAKDRAFVVTEEETADMIRRGETVWCRAQCDCKLRTCTVCEMNAAADTWDELKDAVDEDDSFKAVITSRFIDALETHKITVDQLLDNELCMGGKSSMTSDEISKRGHY